MMFKQTDLPRSTGAAVIGSGFSGLAMAAELKRSGHDDFLILERADDVAGTWRDNTYPGCACDVPSHLYSYSFAPNPDWSHAYGRRKEILDYLRTVAAEHRVERYVRFDTEMREARWDDEGSRWVLDTDTGVLTTRLLVSASGP